MGFTKSKNKVKMKLVSNRENTTKISANQAFEKDAAQNAAPLNYNVRFKRIKLCQ